MLNKKVLFNGFVVNLTLLVIYILAIVIGKKIEVTSNELNLVPPILKVIDIILIILLAVCFFHEQPSDLQKGVILGIITYLFTNSGMLAYVDRGKLILPGAVTFITIGLFLTIIVFFKRKDFDMVKLLLFVTICYGLGSMMNFWLYDIVNWAIEDHI